MSGSESSEVQELQEKDVIVDRVRKLFGDDVAQKFQGKLIKKTLGVNGASVLQNAKCL